jgi:hypothetical protein
MSALPPKADINRGQRYVRFVPKADIHEPGVCLRPIWLLGKDPGSRQNNLYFGELTRLCLDLY